MRSVGIGEIVTTDDPDEVIQMVGLGSCVGTYLIVPGRALAAAHVLLPDSNGNVGTPGKFADTAIPELLRRIESMGHTRMRVQATIIGGAQVLSLGGNRPEFEIGRRNGEAVRSALKTAGIRVAHDDTGGTKARSFRTSASELRAAA